MDTQKRADWTAKEVELLKKHYPDWNTDMVTLVIDRSESAINHKAFKLNLKKSEKFMASSKSGRFGTKLTLWKRLKKICSWVG